MKSNIDLEIMKDIKLRQSPIVILNDCLLNKNVWQNIKSIGNQGSFPVKNESSELGYAFDDTMNGLLTPIPSSSSSCGDCEESLEEPVKKKRKKLEEDEHSEVERIVGYHIDKHGKMWYLLKWKGWSKEYNTFEVIEHLTNCNKLLMKYFEYKKPNRATFNRMDKEVLDSLVNSDTYSRLIHTNFKREELLRFPKYPTLDLSLIFSKKFEVVHKRIKKEYEFIIRCLIGMCLHRDPGMFVRAQHYKIALKVCEIRTLQMKTLKQQEDKINAVEECYVQVMNDKDLDTLPEELEYLTELKEGFGVHIPKDPYVGCNCLNGCSPRSTCCGPMMDSNFAYTKDRKLKEFGRFPIYECNWRCKCSSDCPNRVVQRGRTAPVAIFKTEKCGWGIKALKRIPKGSFVCEYVGELISQSEAVVRDVEYFPKNMMYMFDLDFTPDREALYCIDATRCGNLSRFINHSCNPNLVVCPVWIECLDPNMPRLGFFARHDIMEGEELSIDYESTVESTPVKERDKKERGLRMISKNRCMCGQSNCREWLFGSR